MPDMFRIDNQVTVVIGGAGSIGRVLGLGLAEYGAKVAVADLNREKAEQVARHIRAKYPGSEASAFQFDITDEKSVIALRKKIISRFGTVHVLVNSQGINIKKPAAGFPVRDWDNIFNINVRGTMLTCREFGKIMIKQHQGKIINLSSVRGVRATTWGGNEGYAASKAAVDMITRSLASEWAPYNIHVNAIGPSTVASPFSVRTLRNPERLQKFLDNCPLGRIGIPEDVVGACIFLASPASDFVTGQIFYLDGGLTAIG